MVSISSLPYMQSTLNHLKRVFTVLLIAVLTIVYSPQPALASMPFNIELPTQLTKILSNRQLVSDAKKFLNTTPDKVCKAYFDNLNGIDSSTWNVIQKGGASARAIVTAVTSASTAGAGSLTGYAGIASVVSQMGLGGVTTTIAGLMGSGATGAAATAVVTSAVGGPMVMGGLLVGGTGAVAFGTYKLGEFTLDKLENWAENYCSR
jgi:hypothetical protein